MLYEAGLHAELVPPSINLMRQKKTKLFTAPAKYVLALQNMQDNPSSHFLLIFSERIPAQTPSVEYDELKTKDDMSPK